MALISLSVNILYSMADSAGTRQIPKLNFEINRSITVQAK